MGNNVKLQKWQEELLEMQRKIKLSNPEKLASKYYLVGGERLKLEYVGQTKEHYVYNYSFVTRYDNKGHFTISKELNEFDNVVVQISDGNEVRDYQYRKDTFRDFNSFTERFIAQIKLFHRI